MLWVDLETRSQVDLKSQGLHRYADSPTTEVICMSYAFDDGAITTWFNENGQFPLSVSRYIKSGGAIYAHNASFERIIFEKVLGIEVALIQWRCSAARAMYSGLPYALKNLCIALELPIQKQVEGARLIREYSMPNYLTEWRDGDRQLMQDYCEMDVATMRLACKLLPEPSDEMWRQYHITEDINDQGVPVDVSFAAAAVERSGELREDVNQQLTQLTGGLVTRHTERKSRDQWFRDNFTDDQLLPLLDDEKIKFDKPRREALMVRAETPEPLAKYAELIESAGGSTVSKYESMVNTHIDGTVRGSLIWSGAASTGRFCLAEGTEIIVLNVQGDIVAKPIQDLLDCDLVWDGDQFVEHEGLSFSGELEVIEYDGVEATPDHKVFCEDGITRTILEAYEGDHRIKTVERPI